ncbi:MAG: hypothetical protein IKR67_06820 [Lachnospiraceae bacterium]|nr:hypothetical protein [Lachnospiraceae bacterium]
MRIKSIAAKQVYSDLGPAAIEVSLETETGIKTSALATPFMSGNIRYAAIYDYSDNNFNKGLGSSVNYINTVIAPRICDVSITDIEDADSLIFEEDKENAGLAGIAAFSQASAKAIAIETKTPLFNIFGTACSPRMPLPVYSAANGSTRYSAEKNEGNKPEYFFVSYGFENYSEGFYALWITAKKYATLLSAVLQVKVEIDSQIMIPKDRISTDIVIFDIMTRAIEDAGYVGRVGIGVDLSGNLFFDGESNSYVNILKKGSFSSDEFIDEIAELCSKYDIKTLINPFDINFTEGYEIIKKLGVSVIVSDWLFESLDEMTEYARYNSLGICMSLENSGTISAALNAARIAKEDNRQVVLATNGLQEETLADYAVALGCDYLCCSGISFIANRIAEIDEIIRRG